MEREWFENRKRVLRNLGYLNMVLLASFFVFYMVVRTSAISAHTTYSTPQQLQDILDARRRVDVGFWLTAITAMLGVVCFAKKAKLQADYNAHILAVDPRLEGDFIPLVK